LIGQSSARGKEKAASAGYGRDFRLYAGGQAVSLAGDRIATIALVFLVLQLSGSFAPAIAFFYIARVLPTLVAGLIVGALADEVDRKRLMIGCDLGRAVLVGIVPAAVLLGLWTIYPIVVAVYALNLVFTTSARAALPDVVPESRLLGANSILFSLQTAADVAYAVGGFLVFALGLRAPFFVDAATFVFSAAMISLMRLPVRDQRTAMDFIKFVSRIRSGIAYLLGHGFLKWSSIAYAVASIAVGIGFVISPLYANDVLSHSTGLVGPLHSGAFRFGVLQVALGVGAFIGSRATTPLATRWRSGRLFGLGMTVTGIADALLAFTNNIYVAAAVLALSGFFTSLFVVTALTLLQTLTPTEIRGRIVAGRSTIIQTSIAIGAALAGVALLALPVRPLWLIEGGIFVVASLFVWLRPEVRGQP
jgi:MFS family permease